MTPAPTPRDVIEQALVLPYYQEANHDREMWKQEPGAPSPAPARLAEAALEALRDAGYEVREVVSASTPTPDPDCTCGRDVEDPNWHDESCPLHRCAGEEEIRARALKAADAHLIRVERVAVQRVIDRGRALEKVYSSADLLLDALSAEFLPDPAHKGKPDG